MERKTPLMSDETYHIFNRGAHKQAIFLGESDFQRFQILLLLMNSSERVDAGNLLAKYQGESLVNLFDNEVPSVALVDVLAYALLPNHFHLVLRQSVDNGISTFMRKLCTGYSMYFNLKNEHSGTLFQGPFRSSHINSAPYFNWLFAYVHLNPVSIAEPEWKEKGIKDTRRAQKFLNGYRWSSYFDYYTAERSERAILAHEEGIQHIEKQRDIQALLVSYGHGRVLHPSLEGVEKKVGKE
jgi:putative transposase